ncbi:hypothetical protein BSL78_26807 [Apostichopus japonicus]|uniref:Metallo-beta-lactamase domain-containing protein n=1 Tax=Stichopus japonicus TaxID=307972 RepID=A0A2G8JKV1_STIJA|nr:hypothetical protein BSL78_26807 [Apostichopus japonicus]
MSILTRKHLNIPFTASLCFSPLTMASSDGNRNESSSIVPQIQNTFMGKSYHNPARWQFKIVDPSNINLQHYSAMINAFLYKGQSSDDTVMTVESGLPRDESMEMQPPSDNGNPEAGEPAVTPSSLKRKVVEDLNDDQISQLQNPPRDKVQVLWIGHASLLIQMEGKNILTDPVFSDTVGMTNVLGYHRYRKPALDAEALTKLKIDIDIVLISHNHYDHLDKASVKKLAALKSASAIQWFVPMGLKKKFVEWGCKEDVVKECTWWGQSTACGMMLYFTPAKHWSARGPYDWYTSLWGSWIVKSKRFTVFFAGDTGYQEEIFTDISERFGRVDVALLPIGAYEPRQMMKCQHINPEEAVKIHQHLQARKSIGIHWRTFKLSTEGVDQPITDLKRAMKEHRLDKNDFVTLEEDLMTTIDYAEKEEKDSKEKFRKCVCGNANRYKRYVNGGELLGVLCEKCGKEWLLERYVEDVSKVDGNSLLYEENIFYFHNAQFDHPPRERNTEQFTLETLKEGDHLVLSDCEETLSGHHEAIVETIHSESILSVISFRRSSPSEVTISRAKLDVSELKNAKVVAYASCDPTELVKARAFAWCDGCPQVANLFEFQCLARYCKCGSDEYFRTWWLVGVPFTNTLSGLVDHESWTVCKGPNTESSVSELREVKAVGAVIEINKTSIILDLSNGRTVLIYPKIVLTTISVKSFWSVSEKTENLMCRKQKTTA